MIVPTMAATPAMTLRVLWEGKPEVSRNLTGVRRREEVKESVRSA
jgi:hypothetical protein